MARNTSASRRMPVIRKPSDCSGRRLLLAQGAGLLDRFGVAQLLLLEIGQAVERRCQLVGLDARRRQRLVEVAADPVGAGRHPSHLLHVVLVRARLALTRAAEDEEDEQDGEHDRAADERDQPAARAQPGAAAAARADVLELVAAPPAAPLLVQPVGRRLLARVDVLEEVELDVVVRGPCAHGTTGAEIRPTVAH